MAESAGLEHKAWLDLASHADKVKLVAEVVAMANAEGGVIRVGVSDDGTEAGISLDVASRFDPGPSRGPSRLLYEPGSRRDHDLDNERSHRPRCGSGR